MTADLMTFGTIGPSVRHAMRAGSEGYLIVSSSRASQLLLNAKTQISEVFDMRIKQRGTINSAKRRLEVQAHLAEYPDLSSDKIAGLINWFQREATASEVAAVISNLEIQDSYCQFRNKHLDNLTTVEILISVVFGSFLIAGIVSVMTFT